jgi:hypothetical protein
MFKVNAILYNTNCLKSENLRKSKEKTETRPGFPNE